MGDWKKRLSDYDQKFVTEAESKVNIGKETVEFPSRTVDLSKIVDSSIEPPVILQRSFIVARHFVGEVYRGNSPVRILDIGANPMHLDVCLNGERLDFVASFVLGLMGGPDSFKYPLAAHLSRLNGVRVCATDVQPPPSVVNWLDAEFVLGDFTSRETRERIMKSLDGFPDIVLGEYVFIENLGQYQREVDRPLSGNDDHIGERLTQIAWEMLPENGYMIVNNGKNNLFGRDYLPGPLKQKAMSHFYWDSFTQIFRKNSSG